MKGEKISQITTDIGMIIAVVTFFGCALYLALDMHTIILDGWTGVWLRAGGVFIAVSIGYMPYWLMSVFYKYMRYPFFGFGASMGFMIVDLTIRIALPVFGIFHESGYLMPFGIAAFFVVLWIVIFLGEQCIVMCFAHSDQWNRYVNNIKKELRLFVYRRIF